MPRYIELINFTEQGVKTIKDWDKRLAAGRENATKVGGKLVDAYLTLGEVDAVVILDYPDDAAALRGSLGYALIGNGRTRTLRAFGEGEAMNVIKSLP